MDRAEVLARLFARQYGSPIVRNDLRGELVEQIVGMALEPEWGLCGGDWASHDLQHCKSGLKIQVKQSAATQSWEAGKSGRSSPRFSIATKTGRYEGPKWIAGESRNADIFIFAWHAETGADCDHADPKQWTFFVVAEADLPALSSVGLSQLRKLTEPVEFAGLRDAVTIVSVGLA